MEDAEALCSHMGSGLGACGCVGFIFSSMNQGVYADRAIAGGFGCLKDICGSLGSCTSLTWLGLRAFASLSIPFCSEDLLRNTARKSGRERERDRDSAGGLMGSSIQTFDNISKDPAPLMRIHIYIYIYICALVYVYPYTPVFMYHAYIHACMHAELHA